jgi:thiamine biosynthesis protein ThiI
MAEYLVRLAPEIATKARRTRKRFVRVLLKNMRDCLRSSGIDHTIDDRWSRLFVTADDETTGRRIAGVFGVSSVSTVEARTSGNLDEIVRVGEELFRDRVSNKTYAVRARRAGTFAFGTQDVNVQLGAALNQYGTVDLSNPDVTVSVELRDGEALLFCGRVEGVGGLPLGVEGRAVCLLSGGFDSPVAAWMMLKRGVALDYVFCNLGGEAYERAVVSVAMILADAWSFGDKPRIHVIDFDATVAGLKETVTPRYWQLVLKRLMYRAAEQVAKQIRAQAVVTGESIGQVSSQTLHNLRAIDAVATMPVFRPVVALDKYEIIERAERIGTAALSAHIREYCAILPDRPVTKSTPRAVESEEQGLDLETLRAAVTDRKVLKLRELRAVDLVQPYLFATTIDDGVVVIDCREEHQYQAWHYPGAEHWNINELAARFGDLEKTRTYVLYCAFGVLTAHVAEAMQRAGYEAYSFRGGSREMRRYAEGQGKAGAQIGIGAP